MVFTALIIYILYYFFISSEIPNGDRICCNRMLLNRMILLVTEYLWSQFESALFCTVLTLSAFQFKSSSSNCIKLERLGAFQWTF